MKNKKLFLINTGIVFFLFLFFTVSLQAQTTQLEKLDRGVVAIPSTEGGIFVSWRFLGTDVESTGFDLYRDGVKVNDALIRTVTNYTDLGGTVSSKYVLQTIVNDEVIETSNETAVWADGFLRIALQRPPSGITPAYSVKNNSSTESHPNGQEYDYSPNDMSVGDVDGDGEYELIVKWDPSNSRDNSHRGYTGNVYLDCYKLDGTFKWRIDLGRNIRAGAHYTQFLVYDFDGDGKAEVVCRTAPGTIDGQGNYVLLDGDSADEDYRQGGSDAGLIYSSSAKEYLTVFNGDTGAEITSIPYEPAYGSTSSWGDNYGNRQNRFLACAAYLDGVKPSIVMCRGYYTRAVLVAYDFDGQNLTRRWIHDSPDKGKGAYGEGAHSLAVGDVDGDGCDDIVYGACVINGKTGALMYRTGWGHGDATHLGDMDPDREGLEFFMPHEEKSSPYGFSLRDARTGEIIGGEKTGSDVGRGLAADIDPNHRGYEFWSTANGNIYDCHGDIIATSGRPSVNFRIYWTGDLQDELLDGSVISKYDGKKANTIIDLSQYHNAQSCNSTKKTPNLSADILGDWREEVILWDGNTKSHIMIFTTNTPTIYRIPTLMHDHIYRMAIVWQNVAYNQPPHVGYFMGDLDTESVRFIKNGNGELSQVKELGFSLKPITYKWVNATDVEATGLPEGVTLEKDLNNLTFTISGTPTEVGTFEYTVTSVGGLNEASISGTIRVRNAVNLVPVAQFLFDETSGNTAKNEIYGQAEAVNFTPTWVEGAVGNALQLPASPTDRRMVQAHYDEFDFGDEDFSFEVLFRSEGGSGVDWYLFHKGSHAKNTSTGTTGKWIGLQYKNGNLTFGIDDDDDNLGRGKTNIDVPAEAYFNNVWRHVVGVRDREEGKIKLYIDGELKDDKVDITGNISQVEDFVIGNCNVNFNTPFNGVIDHLTFYKGAMTDDRVEARYKELLEPVSVKEVKRSSFVNIYPTYFTNQITLDFAVEKREDVRIAIYSISGTQVYTASYRIDGNENLVISGLDFLTSGVYTVVVETANDRVVKKVMK